MNICMIITAAGTSSRQKQNKLLMRSCNETIIEKTIYTFTNIDVDIFVVVGHQKEELIPIIEHRFGTDINIVVNENYQTGIASSIVEGVNAGQINYEYYGFCNGDKPFIKKKTVSLLLDYISQNKPQILVPIFQEKVGHPTFFSHELLNDLVILKGDIGGSQVIKEYQEKVTYIPVDDEGITLDMDKHLLK